MNLSLSSSCSLITKHVLWSRKKRQAIVLLSRVAILSRWHLHSHKNNLHSILNKSEGERNKSKFRDSKTIRTKTWLCDWEHDKQAVAYFTVWGDCEHGQSDNLVGLSMASRFTEGHLLVFIEMLQVQGSRRFDSPTQCQC